MSWDHGYFYPPSRPRKVEGGIKARGARGSIGESWWSRRFVDVVESFALGSRMTRGRSYARAGQVISLVVAPGSVTAQVQGSRVRPYTATIGLKPLTQAVWNRIEVALAQQALYSASLLAGEMPHELEDVFAAVGAPLFPASVRDLTMRCSCPDGAVPCKHLAATFYLLAEAFDADPFQILYWRGKQKDELLERLRELRSAGGGDSVSGGAAGSAGAGDSVSRSAGAGGSGHGASDVDGGTGGHDQVAAPVGAALALADVAVVPLAECVARFWVAPHPLPQRPVAVRTPPDLLLRQLPVPSRRLGGARLVDRLRKGYDRFASNGDNNIDA